MKMCVIVGVLMLGFLPAANAGPQASYLLPITRDGKTVNRVARNFWSGEYPQPVIDVNANKKGETTVSAFKSLRDKKDAVKCTIKNGVYHPWSKTPNSMLETYTIQALSEYEAKTDVATDAFALKAGQKLTRVAYLAEGLCEAYATGPGKKERRLDFSCDELKNPGLKEVAGQNDKFSEQWLQLKCKDGTKAFVEDKALLAQPGVKEGEISEYGSVTPAKR